MPRNESKSKSFRQTWGKQQTVSFKTPIHQNINNIRVFLYFLCFLYNFNQLMVDVKTIFWVIFKAKYQNVQPSVDI